MACGQTNPLLIDKRKYPFQLLSFHFLRKFFLITLVDGACARHQVGKGPDEEHQTRNRPGEDGKTQPFRQFSEIVGGSHIIEQTAFGQVVFGIIVIFSQMADDIVGMQVDNKACDKENGSDDKLGRP